MSQVKAVILTFDGMEFGTGQLGELRRAIEHLKSSGKKVYAYAEDMETRRVWPALCGRPSERRAQSTLWLTGMYGESLYVKGLLDKIGVQADFLHMGDYKSAAEMLTAPARASRPRTISTGSSTASTARSWT